MHPACTGEDGNRPPHLLDILQVRGATLLSGI